MTILVHNSIPQAPPPVPPDQRANAASATLQGTVAECPLPYWWPAHRPHPAWCDYIDQHVDGAPVDDRFCSSESSTVELSLHDPLDWNTETPQPDYLNVNVEQRATDAHPSVRLGLHDSFHGRNLTAAEARQLAATLLKAADQAESETGQ